MKKILSFACAAVLTFTAAVPFVSVAENQKISSETELMAEMRKNVQEYMESKGRVKLSQRAANACHFTCILERWTGDKEMEMYVGKYSKNDTFYFYDVHYDVSARILNLSLTNDVSSYELSDYLKENFGDCVLGILGTERVCGFDKFLPDDSKIDFSIEIDNVSNMKVVADALLKSGYASSCYAQFGNAYWSEVTYSTDPLSCFKPTSVLHISPNDKRYSDVQDIFNLISSGTIDAEFGIVIGKDHVDEGLEYNEVDFSGGFYDWTKFAYIPLTAETDFTKFSDDFIDNIHAFTAVPYEESLESQGELLADIYEIIPIWAMLPGSLSINGLCSGSGYMFDVANTVNGDANCDGEYTIADATAILQSLGNPDKYGLSLQGEFNADIHNVGDGVTTMDALEVQKAMAKKG